MQMIDTKKYDLNSFVDNNGANLLHLCAMMGNAVCLSYLKSYIDTNKPDNKGATPLAVAAVHQHKGGSSLAGQHAAGLAKRN